MKDCVRIHTREDLRKFALSSRPVVVVAAVSEAKEAAQYMPIFASLVEVYGDRVDFTYFDVDADFSLVALFDVPSAKEASTPAFFILEEGVQTREYLYLHYAEADSVGRAATAIVEKSY